MRSFYSVPLALLALTVAAQASSGVPSPANSSVPSCLQVCPYGDLTYTIVVRDLANNTIAGSSVVIDFTNCPAVHLCPPITGRTIREFTNTQGVATFAIKGGGGCANAVLVYADGVLLTSTSTSPSVASPDQNGDLFVNGLDQVALTAKAATDPTADLNCDGVHDAADDAVIAAHIGHYCDGVIPVAPHSWGQLKVHYR